jgi:uncharacterized protein (TIRG00374 family)
MKRKAIAFSIQIAMAAIFLYLTFQHTQFHELGNTLKNINYFILVSALIPQLSAVYILALREKYLLMKLHAFKTNDLIKGAFISIIGNNTLPFRAGEFLKTYYWSKLSRLPYLTLFSIAFIERILDLCILILLFFCASKTIFNEMGIHTAFVGILLMLSLSPIAISVCCNSIIQKKLNEKEMITNKIGKHFVRYIQKMNAGIQAVRSIKEMIIVIFLSIVYWTLNLSTLMLMLHSFHFTFTLSQSIIILLATTLGIAIPSAPGYIGTLDYFTKTVLVLYDVNHSTAASFAIMSHIVTFIPITLIGLLFTYSTINQLIKNKRQINGDEKLAEAI